MIEDSFTMTTWEATMVKHKYGTFKSKQIRETKESMRKQIFFLLLLADPATKGQYPEVDIHLAFNNLMNRISGFNSLLSYPIEIVDILSILEQAQNKLNEPTFDFESYRKLVLDAGARVNSIKEE